MGPANPWSPSWRPDPSGRRLADIRAARRGAILAALLYLPVGVVALSMAPQPAAIGSVSAQTLEALAIALGLPAVALLGAGLAPAALGSRIDAAVVVIAFAVGAPVAAVTSLVIGGLLLGAYTAGDAELAGRILRGGVSTAAGASPLVVVAATAWVVVVRRMARSRQPQSSPTS
jgi:hypothetical protein